MSAAPTITSIEPAVGPTSGGTQVSIAGSGLSSASDVLFGTAPGSIISVSDSLILAVTPAGGSLGNVDVRVDTPNGGITWPGGFDYQISVASIYPASGSAAGGTSVAITGSGMLQVYGA